MITNRGKDVILRYLAGLENQIGSSLEVGVGTAAFALTDTGLSFPAYAADVEIIGVNTSASRIIFKSTLPDEAAGVFTEMGLNYSGKEVGVGQNPSIIISFGNPLVEEWSGGEYVVSNVRLNSTGIRMAAANNTVTARMLYAADLSGYSNFDQFKIMVHRVGSVSTFRLKFGTSDTDFYTATWTPPVGFSMNTLVKTNFVATGAADWSNIQYVQLETVSTTTGEITFDALRLDDKDIVNQESFLVSRVVLGSPITKIAGRPLEIEYGLNVTI